MVIHRGATIALVLGAGLFAPSCGGKLLPEPGITTLAAAQNTPVSVAVDSTSVYWTNSGAIPEPSFAGSYPGANGAIMRAPLGGGAPVTLAFTGRDSPNYIAADTTGVYWTSNLNDRWGSMIFPNGGSVMRIALEGGRTATLTTGESPSGGLAVTGGEAFWTHFGGISQGGTQGCVCAPFPACATGGWCGNPDNGAVMRLEPAGKPAALVSLGQAGPSGIAVDTASVYWTNQYAGTVVKMARTGGTPTVLATGQQLPTALVVDGASVYWTNQGSGARTGAIMKVSVDGGVPRTLAAGQTPAGIAADDENVFWTNASSLSSTTPTGPLADGKVMRVAVTGGPPVELASGQSNPMGITVDATSVYWANNGSQTCSEGAAPSCSYNGDGAIMKRTPK